MVNGTHKAQVAHFSAGKIFWGLTVYHDIVRKFLLFKIYCVNKFLCAATSKYFKSYLFGEAVILVGCRFSKDVFLGRPSFWRGHIF